MAGGIATAVIFHLPDVQSPDVILRYLACILDYSTSSSRKWHYDDQMSRSNINKIKRDIGDIVSSNDTNNSERHY